MKWLSRLVERYDKVKESTLCCHIMSFDLYNVNTLLLLPNSYMCFEKFLSFNKTSFCVVFLFVFELPWSITRKLLIIYWLRYQIRIWVILMILSYIAHIYPMKGFLKMSEQICSNLGWTFFALFLATLFWLSFHDINL